MAKKIKIIDYDSSNDILFISNEEKVKTSIDIGDFVLDVNNNNFICGLEVMDASENLGISKKLLNNIKNIKMNVLYRTDNICVLLTMLFQDKGKEVNMSIPLSLNLGHKTPQKEMMVSC